MLADPTESPLYRWRFGEAELDEARLELRVGGGIVELERKPLQVLAYLLHHAGEVVTKRELLDNVWAGRVTVDHVLATAVGKLRKALGEQDAARILTVPRIGYRFDGAAERISVGRRPLSVLSLLAGEPVPGRTHFRLQRQLGSGRGSEVWLGRHSKTRDLRVYKFAPDAERLGALKREATLARVLRQGLAQRDDIARVLDWNFDTEPFFLECEYGGEALTEWAASGVLDSWNPRQRLQFFLQIADAVAAAHGLGVLHKDLKPANVLVSKGSEGDWQVRLTDFGNSRLLDSDKLGELGITALGFTLPDVSGGDSSGGTPLYLAPEVIAGQTPTMQSDVYALGVLLYQLMVGDLRRVMAPGWERDIDDELLCEDVALATDGDPPRRLGSVTELSERLRRLPQRRQQLARTVQAERQVEAAQRALERARARRPWVVAAASALLLGLAVSLWFAQQTQSARVIAESQAARAEAVSGFLQDLIMSADRGTPAVGYDLTVREALTRSSALLDARFANAPLTEALVRMAVAEVYGSLGEFDAAAGHLRRSVALLSAGNGPQSPQTLEARYRLGAALVGASDYEAARSILTAADTDAAALPAAETGAALARARAWSRFHLMQAEAADAVPYLERAQRLQLAHAPEDFPALHDLRIDLAQAYSHLGRFDDAVALMETLDSSARVETLSPSKRAWTRFLHGAALLYSARLEEAEPMLLEAVAELSSVWGADSLQTAQAQGALGNLYFSAGRFREALPHVDAARQTLCSLNGRDHQACLQQTGNLGIARLHAGDSAGAVAQLAAARAGFEQRWGITSPGTQVFGYYLATAQVESGDAIAAAAIAADLDPALLAAGSPGTHWETRVQALQGAILLATGRRDEGISLLQPAVAAMEADQTQEWIIGPFRQQLEGAASTQRSTGL